MQNLSKISLKRSKKTKRIISKLKVNLRKDYTNYF